MKHHDLKIWPVPFAEVRAGRKTFEIRDNDRDYQSGDTVTLREWDPLTHTYTGKREGPFTVGTVIPAGEWGLPENLCVFSLLRHSHVVMPEEVDEALQEIDGLRSRVVTGSTIPLMSWAETLAAEVRRLRAELAALRSGEVDVLRKLVEVADTNPFCSVGHFVEHVEPETRARLAALTPKEPAP